MHRDARLAALAARQHGVVTVAQLAALGIGRGAVAHRIRTGRVRRLHHGVYLVGPLTTPLTAPAAALLAAGRGAVLTLASAAALWDMRDWPATIDVVVPAERDPRPRGNLRVHRSRHLPADDIRRRDGLAATAPARTLVDLAAVVDRRELERLVDQARLDRLVTPAGLCAQVARSPGRPGVAALRTVADETPGLTRSEAERRLRRLLRAAQLPPFETNVHVARHEVDVLWREQRLVVEVDGYAYHGTRAAFERDRRRDADLRRAGYDPRRFTWRQIAEDALAIAAEVAATLVAARSRPPPRPPAAA